MMADRDAVSSGDTTVLVDTKRDSSPYPTRWAQMVGVLQTVLGVACIALNIAFHVGNTASRNYGVWCGIIIIVSGVVQIISGKTNMKCWIVICFLSSILAAGFAAPVFIFSSKNVRHEIGMCIKGANERTVTEEEVASVAEACRGRLKYRIMFGCMELIGVVEFGVGVVSALVACKGLRFSFSCPFLIRKVLKRFVDKEKNDPFRAVRLGKTQIVLGLLAIAFNATAISVGGSNAGVGHGMWCGIFFVLGGCFLYMSEKSRFWISVCFPFLILAMFMAIPMFTLSIVGLLQIINKHHNKMYDIYHWNSKDSRSHYIGKTYYGTDAYVYQHATQIAMSVGLIVVALVEFVVALLSWVQIGRCFKCGGKCEYTQISQETDPEDGAQPSQHSPGNSPAQEEMLEVLKELTTTVKELKQELAVVREEVKASSASREVLSEDV